MERRNAWTLYNNNDLEKINEISEGYKSFIDNGKTERKCVELTINEAEKTGYRNLADVIKNNEVIKAGDKVYASFMGKTVALFNIGKENIEDGINILCAHIDSPRIDIKQNPVYEDSDFVYLDTHYYGGIKKYHWVAMPLSLQGVVAKKNGEVVEVSIGDKDDEPVLYITDLLPHLGAKQMGKKASEVIEGEQLDLLIGSMPSGNEEDKEKVKNTILNILKDKYGFEEEDFLSAELEIVPAGKSRDCGLDRSMIVGYGQDDRVCAYTSLIAMLDVNDVNKTTCCLLVDKEEIGSVGATGMHSRFFENTVAEILEAMGKSGDIKVRRTLMNSSMLSSDVSAAFDPQFKEAFEPKNSAYFGRGIVLNKYTGARGKGGSNDANAEYVARIRKVFDDNNISFQTAELGKVDFGGGGTIAYIAALYGMEVIDSGIAVLSMHSPWEVTSKADLYEATKAYKAFLREI